MARTKKAKSRIAVIDFETDPFLYDRKPHPFSAGFYDGEIYMEFWGTSDSTDKEYNVMNDCVLNLLSYIESRKEPLTIYAHNGGKFDFFFLLEKGAIQNPVLIIHGRIVKARLLNIHEIRDSYAILPLPLAKLGSRELNKLEFDYKKLEKEVRNKFKSEILEYQKIDCLVLHDVVFKFIERFGNKLTVGATAIAELGKLHPVSKQNKSHDTKFRKYYFGGRVECFESGHVKARPNKRLKVYDVNSMYPDAMKRYPHPAGGFYVSLKSDLFDKFNHRTGDIRGFGGMYFMRFIGHNNGAIPKRNEKTGGLDFNCTYGEFYACSHEIKVACELGLIKVEQIIDVHIPCSCISFGEFVDKFGAEKVAAKESGDIAGETFAKLISNSAYGKYATDPGDFKEWYIFADDHTEDELIAFQEWRNQYPRIIEDGKVLSHGAQLINLTHGFEIWSAPNPDDKGYFDVAVAASITSAARSNLLRAIYNSDRPLYCDTDSIISEGLSGVEIHSSKLGAWKFEGESDHIYIAGKKMYAMKLLNPDNSPELDKKSQPKIKLASKGAKLTYDDIASICNGALVHYKSDAPNFKLNGDTKFVARNIKKTA